MILSSMSEPNDYDASKPSCQGFDPGKFLILPISQLLVDLSSRGSIELPPNYELLVTYRTTDFASFESASVARSHYRLPLDRLGLLISTISRLNLSHTLRK